MLKVRFCCLFYYFYWLVYFLYNFLIIVMYTFGGVAGGWGSLEGGINVKNVLYM